MIEYREFNSSSAIQYESEGSANVGPPSSGRLLVRAILLFAPHSRVVLLLNGEEGFIQSSIECLVASLAFALATRRAPPERLAEPLASLVP